MKTFVVHRQRVRAALLLLSFILFPVTIFYFSPYCPMSLPVSRMVEAGNMESSDCILCGNCIDSCRKKVIAYRFGRADRARGMGKEEALTL